MMFGHSRQSFEGNVGHGGCETRPRRFVPQALTSTPLILPKGNRPIGELALAELQLCVPKVDHDGGYLAAPTGTLCREPTQVPEIRTADRRRCLDLNGGNSMSTLGEDIDFPAALISPVPNSVSCCPDGVPISGVRRARSSRAARRAPWGCRPDRRNWAAGCAVPPQFPCPRSGTSGSLLRDGAPPTTKHRA